MYKVVLIDDEAIILEGLQKVVDWAGFGCSIVAVAGNATDGAAAIRRHKPDILFTDIKMPDQDGLTMLAGLKSEFPDMQITVLTGYRDFDCAQEAIRLGITRLLLKPSRLEEISEAIRAMTENLHPQEEAAEVDKAASGFLVREALRFMSEHYMDKLSLQDVSDRCYVSQWHLSKLLNKQTGQSFYDLLNAMRIDKAKELLSDPCLKIGDIVEMVGYKDPGHFSRVFKKLTGMSANEYRNSHQ